MIGEDLSKLNEIDISQEKKEVFKDRVQKKYGDSVIDQLKERFPYVEQIASFCLVDPSRLPSSPTCGNRDLKFLCDYYPARACGYVIRAGVHLYVCNECECDPPKCLNGNLAVNSPFKHLRTFIMRTLFLPALSLITFIADSLQLTNLCNFHFT